MYKSLIKKDWEKILDFPSEKKIDAIIVSGNGLSNRNREIRLFEESLFKYPRVDKVKNIKDPFFQNICEYKINNKLIWFDVAYGGAYLSDLIHIASIFGSKKNFLVGSCGGLQKDLNIGDIILPTYSYGNESTTRMYERGREDNKHSSDEKLTKDIKRRIKDYNTKEGPIITCQAMLAETKEDVDLWSKEGYLGVEMESSTFFAVSNHFNIPATAILHVSDNLVKNVLYGSAELESKKDFRNKIKIYIHKIILENILQDITN